MGNGQLSENDEKIWNHKLSENNYLIPLIAHLANCVIRKNKAWSQEGSSVTLCKYLKSAWYDVKEVTKKSQHATKSNGALRYRLETRIKAGKIKICRLESI